MSWIVQKIECHPTLENNKSCLRFLVHGERSNRFGIFFTNYIAVMENLYTRYSLLKRQGTPICSIDLIDLN